MTCRGRNGGSKGTSQIDEDSRDRIEGVAITGVTEVSGNGRGYVWYGLCVLGQHNNNGQDRGGWVGGE